MSAKHTKKPAASLTQAELASIRKEKAAYKKEVLKYLKMVLNAPPKKYKMLKTGKHLNSIIPHLPGS
jgi:hypothetical protein